MSYNFRGVSYGRGYILPFGHTLGYFRVVVPDAVLQIGDLPSASRDILKVTTFVEVGLFLVSLVGACFFLWNSPTLLTVVDITLKLLYL